MGIKTDDNGGDPITILVSGALYNWTVSHRPEARRASRRQWLLYRCATEYGWFATKEDAIAVGTAIIAESTRMAPGVRGPIAAALNELMAMDVFATAVYRIDGVVSDVDLPGAITRTKRALSAAINRKYDFLIAEARKMRDR